MTERTIDVTRQFSASVKKLAKKYRRIKHDLTELKTALEAGDTPGDKLSNVGCDAYKVRIKNSDNQKGKSGGYRVLYYLKTQDNVVLLDIYSKSEHDSLSDNLIRQIVHQYLGAE
ncbi:type II toxin-antitoxin system RelE/ParE family toxin [Agaribacter flavus]|uniref:Type II toxin-antitoxin system RelE/ParE family toxin n=1 Tax=Agaribacter flavus TaxID=1902781 RepID=A0ABV7FTD0_9ALTE